LTTTASSASEDRRVAALLALHLLDTPSEDRFDRHARLARRLFEAPVALFSLVDATRLWFKAHLGLDLDEVGKHGSCCAEVIGTGLPLMVVDMQADARFRDHALVGGEGGYRFYAGAPVRGPNGEIVGTLSVLDVVPREAREGDLELLADLAHQVERELEAQSMATIDSLTGISNRRGFMAVAQHALRLGGRHHPGGHLLLFDLDQFRQINLEYGHKIGDDVLVEFADLMVRCFRESDAQARTDGDEFCVILTGTSDVQASAVVARFARMVDVRNQRAHSRPAMVYSVGIAQVAAGDNLSMLLSRAQSDMLVARAGQHSTSQEADDGG
jgi:diguanylate cyclase (GGDEF)-like protein